MPKSQIFCARNNGATIGKDFYPHPDVSTILGNEARRKADKAANQRMKLRMPKHLRRMGTR